MRFPTKYIFPNTPSGCLFSEYGIFLLRASSVLVSMKLLSHLSHSACMDARLMWRSKFRKTLMRKDLDPFPENFKARLADLSH
ncbi:hypothetical protein Pan258_06230 [Symmachiella dynata]|uniref:Uncharacterized protein n=1 Tax=Symmachiella dynata TaxID=2527995 RepID=A0A517ZI21_9PLAN|nr:hypothetical protein Pan258_06230 [Symmachiella dynata]QDU42115.1 hypothetical protein Mal52_05700 [Symmachiella dynata]